MSATSKILGSSADKNDFLTREGSYRKSGDIFSFKQVEATEALKESREFERSSVKMWLSSKSKAQPSNNAEHNLEDVVEHDYHGQEFGKPDAMSSFDDSEQQFKSQCSSLSTVKYPSENFLSHSDKAGDGHLIFNYLRRSWGHKHSHKSRPNKNISDTEEEVSDAMGGFPFIYNGMNDEYEDNDGKENSMHENDFGRHVSTNDHSRALTYSTPSVAKRQWIERRYRRRLKQVSFNLPSLQWSNDKSTDLRQQHPKTLAPMSQFHNKSCFMELTIESRKAFLTAHAALNDRLVSEYQYNKHGTKMADDGYDLELGYDLSLSVDDDEDKEMHAKSSYAIQGSRQIRLPVDNVRLVMDPQLQPGILSVESQVGKFDRCSNYHGKRGRYSIKQGNVVVHSKKAMKNNTRMKKMKRTTAQSNPSSSLCMGQPCSQNELSYVLTVDDRLYQRLFQEMSDSHSLPCGIYYCCHLVESEAGHDHVEIGVAVVILIIVFFFFIIIMLS